MTRQPKRDTPARSPLATACAYHMIVVAHESGCTDFCFAESSGLILGHRLLRARDEERTRISETISKKKKLIVNMDTLRAKTEAARPMATAEKDGQDRIEGVGRARRAREGRLRRKRCAVIPSHEKKKKKPSLLGKPCRKSWGGWSVAGWAGEYGAGVEGI